MNIKQKLGLSTITVLPLLACSLFLSGGIFRPSCTANNRGIGTVSAPNKTSNSVLLEWKTPNDVFYGVRVCYKKSWSLTGKCQDDDRFISKFYGDYVSSGDIDVTGLEGGKCYKFAVYGANPGTNDGGIGTLIGELKTKTN